MLWVGRTEIDGALETVGEKVKSVGEGGGETGGGDTGGGETGGDVTILVGTKLAVRLGELEGFDDGALDGEAVGLGVLVGGAVIVGKVDGAALIDGS